MSGARKETAKIVLIGNNGVGKTSVLFRFTSNKFLPDKISTTGVDFYSKTINIEGSLINLKIWDTAGQERYRTITKSYYHGAEGIVVMFDVSQRDTFDQNDYWINSIKELADPGVEVVLVGNKCDLERKVTKEEADDFAESNNIPYFETSAKDNKNISEMFNFIAKKIYENKKSSPQQQEDNVVKVKDQKSESGSKNEKKGCSC